MIQIDIDTDSLYVNNSENLIGLIRFCFDGFVFVSDDWYDFVGALLSWLAKIMVDLICKEAIKVKMLFMEGPYKLTFTLKKDYTCKVDCIEGDELSGDTEIVHHSVIVPMDQLVNEIIKSCEQIIHLKEQGILGFDKDFEDLRNNYHLLLENKE